MSRLVLASVRIPISSVGIMDNDNIRPIRLKQKAIIDALIMLKISDDSHAWEAIDFNGCCFAKDVPELAAIIKDG